MDERYVREFRDVLEFRDVPELRVPPNLKKAASLDEDDNFIELLSQENKLRKGAPSFIHV